MMHGSTIGRLAICGLEVTGRAIYSYSGTIDHTADHYHIGGLDVPLKDTAYSIERKAVTCPNCIFIMKLQGLL